MPLPEWAIFFFDVGNILNYKNNIDEQSWPQTIHRIGRMNVMSTTYYSSSHPAPLIDELLSQIIPFTYLHASYIHILNETHGQADQIAKDMRKKWWDGMRTPISRPDGVD